MSKPKWKLLTKKSGSSTQGVPPGKEDLAWVTNTVMIISGQGDAVLVHTFLSEQHSKGLVHWVVEGGKNLTNIYITPGTVVTSRSEANRVDPRSLWPTARAAKIKASIAGESASARAV